MISTQRDTTVPTTAPLIIFKETFLTLTENNEMFAEDTVDGVDGDSEWFNDIKLVV